MSARTRLSILGLYSSFLCLLGHATVHQRLYSPFLSLLGHTPQYTRALFAISVSAGTHATPGLYTPFLCLLGHTPLPGFIRHSCVCWDTRHTRALVRHFCVCWDTPHQGFSRHFCVCWDTPHQGFSRHFCVCWDTPHQGFIRHFCGCWLWWHDGQTYSKSCLRPSLSTPPLPPPPTPSPTPPFQGRQITTTGFRSVISKLHGDPERVSLSSSRPVPPAATGLALSCVTSCCSGRSRS